MHHQAWNSVFSSHPLSPTHPPPPLAHLLQGVPFLGNRLYNLTCLPFESGFLQGLKQKHHTVSQSPPLCLGWAYSPLSALGAPTLCPCAPPPEINEVSGHWSSASTLWSSRCLCRAVTSLHPLVLNHILRQENAWCCTTPCRCHKQRKRLATLATGYWALSSFRSFQCPHANH